MTALDTMPWRFGAACAASLVLALLLAALLRAGARRWPALAAHRSVWLLAQGAVALAFVLACVPLPRLELAPTLTLPPTVPLAQDDVAADEAAATTLPAAPLRPPRQSEPPELSLHLLPALWLCAYLAGLAWHATRRIRAARRWQAMLRRYSRIVDGATLRAWPAFTSAQLARIEAAGLTVRATELPLSPVLLGLRRPCLVLPAHLGTLGVEQQRLVLEHELTHWRRADPLWLAVSGLAQLLFWFNLPFRRLAEGLAEAVELGCDDAVLAGRSQRERQGYAAALVAQLSLQRQACSAPAFGQLGVAGRVLRMRETLPPRLSVRGRAAWAAVAFGLAALAAAMQPAFSSATPTVLPRLAVPSPDTIAPEAWRYPLAHLRVTSLYGVRSARLPAGHHGIDFAASRGTPVAAVAGGTVVEADRNPTWGNYVRIDHGAGRQSLAIHLERIAVARGQRVAAGDAIGTAGDSGKASGPHLHLEYWQDGRRRNPELMLGDLNAHATPTALARRQAQGNPVPIDE